MTKDDLKHALISLVLGILITAFSQIILGALHIFQVWASGLIGGSSATVTYLHYKHYI